MDLRLFRACLRAVTELNVQRVGKEMVCSCVDDNGKPFENHTRSSRARGKVGKVPSVPEVQLVISQLYLQNRIVFMLIYRTTFCCSLDADVLVCLVRVCTVVRSRDAISSSFTYIETCLFFTFKPPVCVRVYVCSDLHSNRAFF